MITAIWLTCLMAGHAQEAETFSIATLNVDGLPQKIFVVKVNSDGPGGGGSVRIGRYLQKRGYDMVFMQEDFNYHEELTVPMEDDYQLDSWSGDVGVDGHQIDFLHLQNHRFECDGLMGFAEPPFRVRRSDGSLEERHHADFCHPHPLDG